ncbi:uncharacterized protein LOC110011714 [Sesamum indicum]|uniref:Uncharacterized protein LOC110011714 n=1 Tax=Sesamum indicum TaxID=4182 RepID=A0A8M8UVY3_SESIN|nr:uncharacterized protein LOC110011714 [Sesamum indicum]
MSDDQEHKFFQELRDEDSISRSLLHLSTAANHQPTTVVPPTTSDYTTTCKRHSISSPSSSHQPSCRRATLHPPSSPSSTADYRPLGFTKLPLPHPFPTASPPPLRRTISEPIYSTDTFNSAATPPQLSELPTSPGPVLNQPLQEISNRNIVQESYTLPDTLPVIHRTISDPNPVGNQQVVAGSRTPPLPPLSRNVWRSPSCGESPSTKRLKRMRDRLKEMSQWWNQVACEGEEEENESEDYSTDNITNVRDESEIDMENPPQEAVWVEKNVISALSLIMHREEMQRLGGLCVFIEKECLLAETLDDLAFRERRRKFRDKAQFYLLVDLSNTFFVGGGSVYARTLVLQGVFLGQGVQLLEDVSLPPELGLEGKPRTRPPS